MTKPKRKIPLHNPDELFGRVVSILEQARGNVARAVNTSMVHAYWLIGREIVQELQSGDKRAEYGKKVLSDLAMQLTQRYVNGFSVSNLQNFRVFYLAYSERLTTEAPIQYPVGTKSVINQIQYPTGRKSSDNFESPDKLHPKGGESRGATIPHPLSAGSSESAILSPAGIELALSKKSYPVGIEFVQGFSPQLSWSHYRALMRVDNVEARDFYEREAVAGGWDKRTLERQIHT